MVNGTESNRISGIRACTRHYSYVFPIKVTAYTICNISLYISGFTAIDTDRSRAYTRVDILEVEDAHTGSCTTIQDGRKVGTSTSGRGSLEDNTHPFSGIFL